MKSAKMGSPILSYRTTSVQLWSHRQVVWYLDIKYGLAMFDRLAVGSTAMFVDRRGRGVKSVAGPNLEKLLSCLVTAPYGTASKFLLREPHSYIYA